MPTNVWPSDSLPELEPAFKDLGHTICEVATLLLQHCDALLQHQEYLETTSAAQHDMHPDSPTESSRLSSALRASAAASNGGGSQNLGRLAVPLSQQISNKGRLLHYYSVSPGDDGLWCGWHDDFGTLTGASLPFPLLQHCLPARCHARFVAFSALPTHWPESM